MSMDEKIKVLNEAIKTFGIRIYDSEYSEFYVDYVYYDEKTDKNLIVWREERKNILGEVV
jgi:hypothetical protein